MAHVPADGILGLEGIHTLSSNGVAADVVIKGQHEYSSETAWFKLDRVTGGRGLGEVDDNRFPAEGRLGEVDYPGALRGRTKVYEGRVCARSLQMMRQACSYLEWVCSEMSLDQAGAVTVTPPPWLEDEEDGPAGYAFVAKVIAFDMDEEQLYGQGRLPTAWQRKFMISFRLSDPRHRWWPGSTVGNVSGSSAIVVNAGNAPADLHFKVRRAGAALDASLVLENLTIGKTLAFYELDLDVGDHVQIDWFQRSAFHTAASEANPNPNTDLMPYLDAGDSDWWDSLVPGARTGNNTIKVTSTGATWDVDWHHSCW